MLPEPRSRRSRESSAEGRPGVTPEYDSDEPREYLPESTLCKHVHYRKPGYRIDIVREDRSRS
jgi:hypothetical protein